MDANVVSLATVIRNGDAVQFEIDMRGRMITCSVTREALEDHFWLQPGAGETRLLRTFLDGQKRISAIAERKARRLSVDKIDLTSQDFAR
ncbi:hypothetical protein BGLT_06042 [Caballeronia glathei]|uniref:DUF1488 domain-containing protein n=1 Tax=Caballeronia glathei TaxID=60547 RepID=A0A069PPY7_9BURK|nr:hypothetical protein BG61_14615 [Caballeronia glathei]TCK36665.1 uncharacterized protein DUF1488 [Paraburkholderia sp. BL8N3]CDY77131.1 hypothetical protein BGLT_06042 [Caballeronia glathei]